MNSGQLLILFVPMIAIFYLLVMRPQKKEKNKKILMVKNMLVGDKIMTYSGIYAKVAKIPTEGSTITVTIAKDVDVILEKEAVFKNYSLIEREEKEQEAAKKAKEQEKADKKKNK